MAKKSSKEYVIVRSHTAGVHAGYLESRKGNTLILTQSRRLWRWQGGSLSEVAVYGPAQGENKFGAPVSKTEIISPQGFEIAHCSESARKSIQAVSEWRK
jgi:hypothetical protein